MIPVYILIRTAGRPKFFKKCFASIRSQTYPNIITITHSDNPRDKYVKGDIIVKSPRNTAAGRGFFNLYCNVLLAAIPPGPGYYHFIDDDDIYAAPNVIEKFVKNAKETHINVARVQRWSGAIWPKAWKGQKVFQTECFLLHTKWKNIAKWPSKKGGDHSYTKQITRKLPINWIEGLLVCKAQQGKGRGLRLDLGVPMPPKKRKK
jgi:hypothetical protein